MTKNHHGLGVLHISRGLVILHGFLLSALTAFAYLEELAIGIVTVSLGAVLKSLLSNGLLAIILIYFLGNGGFEGKMECFLQSLLLLKVVAKLSLSIVDSRTAFQFFNGLLELLDFG